MDLPEAWGRSEKTWILHVGSSAHSPALSTREPLLAPGAMPRSWPPKTSSAGNGFHMASVSTPHSLPHPAALWSGRVLEPTPHHRVVPQLQGRLGKGGFCLVGEKLAMHGRALRGCWCQDKHSPHVPPLEALRSLPLLHWRALGRPPSWASPRCPSMSTVHPPPEADLEDLHQTAASLAYSWVFPIGSLDCRWEREVRSGIISSAPYLWGLSRFALPLCPLHKPVRQLSPLSSPCYPSQGTACSSRLSLHHAHCCQNPLLNSPEVSKLKTAILLVARPWKTATVTSILPGPVDTFLSWYSLIS